MNKTETKAKIDALLPTTGQDEYGQYEIGSEGQRKAATLVEYAYNADTISDDMIPHVLLALKDIQVRDYAMGLINPKNDKGLSFFKLLTKHAPRNYNAAPTTLLALVHYEKHEDGKANELLRPMLKTSYSLARLLNRVFETNWPVGAFEAMRMELHPKVKAGIFGEETNDNSNKE